MNISSSPDLSDRAASGRNIPASCPSCRSTSIVSTAKDPDVSSYWLCTACGEIWNVSRRQTGRRA
jgi:transposase-like protein